MNHRCLPFAFLLLATIPTRIAAQPYATDSTAIALSGVAAWDISFHFITAGGDYIQQLVDPYDANLEGIGVFSSNRLSAYYFRADHRRCYQGLPSRYMGHAHLLISPSSCRMFDFFDEQIWLIRAGIERKRLEAPPGTTRQRGA